MTSTHAHRVRSYEVDHQGVVFNGRYLEIADAAMTNFFEGLGWDYPSLITAGMDPSVVAIGMEFHSPARLGDDLEVEVSVDRIGGSSVQLTFAFHVTGQPVATVSTTYVNVTAGVAKSTPIPSAIRTALTEYQEKR